MGSPKPNAGVSIIWKPLIFGVVLAVLALGAVTTYSLWADGKQFALTDKANPQAPHTLAHPSYLDRSRFYWKTASELRQYTVDNWSNIMQEIESTP